MGILQLMVDFPIHMEVHMVVHLGMDVLIQEQIEDIVYL